MSEHKYYNVITVIEDAFKDKSFITNTACISLVHICVQQRLCQLQLGPTSLFNQCYAHAVVASSDVADTNETYVALTVSASGTFNFNITPPVGTAVGTKYLRVRVAEGATHPGFSGLSTLKGEVEDYAVQVVSKIGRAHV
jgi:hypothetical protein